MKRGRFKMAITVYKFPQPYLQLELVAGGSLPVADYYFLGWFQRHCGYYHCAHGPCSEEQMITTTSGNQSIKCTWWQAHGDITSVTEGFSGEVAIHSEAHGLNPDDEVVITGTTNYDGTYTVVDSDNDYFVINHSWDGDDTGEWWYGNSIPVEVTESFTGTSGICFKWDNVSMIMPIAGTPYKWDSNLPNEAQLYTSTYGHRKWGQAYSQVLYRSGTSQTWTELSTQIYGLKDGVTNGSSFASRGQGNMQVAHRDSTAGALLDSSWGELDSKLHIKIDTTDTNNNWDDLISALISSGYKENYRLLSRARQYVGLELIGNYDGNGVGTWTNINICSTGGWRAGNITYNNCQIKWLPTQYQCRTSGDYCVDGTFKNSSFFYNGTSFDLYNYLTADGFSPYGTMTFYQDCEGYTFNSGSGGYVAGYPSFQFRYPNVATPHYMKDITANGMYCSITYSGSNTVKDISVTNYNANNEGLHQKDFNVSYSYTDGDTCVFNWNCVNLASNRPDGKIRIYYSSLGDPASYDETWWSRYNIELTVVDSDNTPIDGAYVTLIGDETSTDTTDASGEATVTMLGYTASPPSSGTGGYSTSSDWKTAKLTITSDGYEDYVIDDVSIREGKDWTVSMLKIVPPIYNAAHVAITINNPSINVEINKLNVAVAVDEMNVDVEIDKHNIGVTVNELGIGVDIDE